MAFVSHGGVAGLVDRIQLDRSIPLCGVFHCQAAVLFIALLFFGWLWGVWGLLLGAPLVAIAKVVCDHTDSLKPVGELLGS